MTMTNAEWMIKQGYKFRELTWKRENIEKYDYDILLNNKCIGKVKDSYPSLVIQTWLDMEHVEPILDEAEKRYLSAVIRPFKDQIISIYKEQFGFNHESIIIEYYDFDRSQSTLCLPQFEKSSMYAGMECDRKYTLEELGI